MKHFTTIHDVIDVKALLKEAIELKKNISSYTSTGKGKTIGLIFLNPSLRTRLSTQKAAQLLGLNAMVMNLDKEGWAIEWDNETVMNGNTTEHIKEAAMVLSTYCDIIGIRCFASLKNKEDDYSEKMLVQLMHHTTVPVISLESATRHPLQSLADIITIQEHWKEKRKPKIVLSWAPHVKALPQAVANSFCEWMPAIDAEFCIANPEEYDLSPDFVKNIKVYHNQEEALKDADIVYVKNWSSFEQYGKMPEVKENWILDEKKYGLTQKAKIMHCLPVRRNLELPDFIMNSKNTLIKEQVENRVTSAMVVLRKMLGALRDVPNGNQNKDTESQINSLLSHHGNIAHY